MNLSCSNCGARYSIADEKVRGKGKTFRIKCKKCATPIVVQGHGGGVDTGKDAARTNALAAVPDDGWYMVVDGEQIGPVTKDVLVAHIEQGDANADTFVWRQGYADWRRFGDVEGFKDVVAGLGVDSGDSRSLAPDDVVSHDIDDHDPTFVQYTLPEEVQRELAQRSTISVITPTVDENARTTVVPMDAFADMRPEPAPAVSKTSEDKRSAVAALSSLFSDDDDVQPPTTATSSKDEDVGGFFAVGDKSQQSEKTMLHQRRESSVLFSLDELDSKKKQQASGAIVDHTSDSGLIDIRAVARRESKAKASLQTAGDLFGDFGSSVAVSETEGAFDTRLRDAAAAPIIVKKKSNGALYGVIAFLVLIIAGAAVFFLVIQPGQREKEMAVAEANRAKAEAEAEAARKAAELAAQQEEAKKTAENLAKTAEAAKLEAEAAKRLAEEQMKKMVDERQAADAAKQQQAVAEVVPQPQIDGAKAPEQPPTKQEKPTKLDVKKADVKDKASEMKDVAQKTVANQPPPEAPKVAQKASQEAASANALLAGLNSAQKNPTPTPATASTNSEDGAGSGSSLPKDLKSSDVRKVVRNYSGKVINCYKNHGGSAEGAAVVSTRVTVSGSGNVTSASVTSGGNAQMVSCIEGALRGMKFPQFQDASQTIDIPFRVN